MKSSRRGTRMKELGLSIALGAGLVGCAVLTVDVDVYKGALVNEEHVQLHQLVALTIAAQPMLVHLRDNLEWPETEGKPPKGATTDLTQSPDDCEGKQWTGSWYEMGHVAAPEGWVAEAPKPWWKAFGETLREWFIGPLCRPHFRNPYARAVNNVLSLYDDLADSDLGPHARKLRQAVEQLRRATSRPEEDQKSYDKIASKLIVTDELRNLKQGYQELLVSSSGSEISRKVGPLMDALKELSDKSNAKTKHNQLEADLLSKWEATEVYRKRDEIYDRRLPFRAVWKFLGEGVTDTFLAEVTRDLCPHGREGNSACDELLRRTNELADKYWESRKAVRDIWLGSLALLIDIERLRPASTRVYDDLKNNVIRLVVEVTDVRHIASALDRLDRDGQCSLLRNPLMRGSFCEVGADGKLAWSEINVRDQIGYFEEVLRRNLSSSPADTAHYLLYLDSLESNAPLKNGVANKLVEAANKVNPQRIVRLGLNRSFIEDRRLEGSSDLFDFVNDVSRKVAQGFERGRLPDGLHTLTEAFLKSHNGNTDMGDSHEEKKLLDALVEFAQKLLFLANHEGLSSPPGTSGLILGGAEKINRGLFGDSLTDAGLYGIFGSGLAENRKQQYIRVLQAVGNSILFSANELRERERYREQGQKKVLAEVAAAKSVYSPDPAKIITDLLAELEHEKQAAQRSLADAKARKAEIETRLGNPTANPKTGLHDKKDKAADALSQAEKNLTNYRKSLSMLEAIQAVLTKDVITQVKSQWKAGQSNPKDEGEFLTGVGGPSLRDALAVVRGSYNSTLPTQEDVQRWADALNHVASSGAMQAFADYRKRENKASLEDRPALLDQFVSHIDELETKRVEGVARHERTRDEKKTELDCIDQEIVALDAEKTRMEEQIGDLPQKEATLQTAIVTIEAARPDVLKQAERHGPFTSPKTIYGLLLSHVKDKEDQEADSKNNQPYRDTQNVLSKRVPPPGMPLLNPQEYKSPREVMDSVIALLRHHQMDVTQR
ncbi:MAG: hypothetical protein KF876_10275, partial [Nitrospira sp.]|nr:hypothetical protein [Nitrospira sp.]